MILAKLGKATFIILLIASVAMPLAWSPLVNDGATLQITILRVLALAYLISAMIDVVLNGKIVLPANRITFSIACFLGLLIISSIFSIHFNTSFFGMRGRYDSLSTYSCYGLIFFAAATTLWDYERRADVLLWVWMATGLAVSLIGILQLFGLSFLGLERGSYEGVTSTLGNPAVLGSYLLFPFALSLAQLFAEDRKNRFLYALAALALGSTIVLTRSAGALLGAGAILLYLVIKSSHNRQLKISLWVLIALGLPSLCFWQFRQASNMPRLLAWKASLQAIAARPLFGYGLGTIQYVYGQFLSPLAQKVEPGIFDDAHNFFLSLAVTSGLPVLIAFLVVLGAALLLILRRPVKTNESYNLFQIGLAAAVIGYICAISANPQSPVGATYFWLALGIVGGIEGKKVLCRPARKVYRALIYTPMAAVVVLLMAASFFPLIAEVYFTRAATTLDVTYATTQFERAIQYNPYIGDYPIRLGIMYSGQIPQGGYPTYRLGLQNTNRAIEAYPWKADYYGVLGYIYYQAARSIDKGLMTKSTEAFDQSLKRDKIYPQGLKYLGLIYYEQDQYKKAKKLFDQYLIMRPDDNEVLSMMQSTSGK